MGGIVFAPGTSTLGRYGVGQAVASGAVIPAGTWYVGAGFVITNGTQSVTCGAGICVSDGVNCTASAALTAIRLGA